jgi:integrase/recombinase XerD
MQTEAIVLAPAGAELAEKPAPPRENPVRVYLGSLQSVNSRRTMVDALRRLMRVMAQKPERFASFPWWKLTPGQTVEIRRRLLEGADEFSINTVKVALSALKGVLFQSFRLGYVDGDAYQRAASWGRVTGDDPILAGRMLTQEEIAAVRAAYDALPPLEAALDGALFEVGLTAGARLHELAYRKLEDLSEDVKTLRIVGKRRKVRTAYLPPHTGAVLESWLAQRDALGIEGDSLFVHVLDGAPTAVRPSPWQVWDRMRRLGEAAGVKFTPHDLRRTFISHALEKTDIVTVQKMAGHADPRTTARYDRRPALKQEKAAMDVGATLAPKQGKRWKEFTAWVKKRWPKADPRKATPRVVDAFLKGSPGDREEIDWVVNRFAPAPVPRGR